MAAPEALDTVTSVSNLPGRTLSARVIGSALALRRRLLACTAALALLVTACGGGGGSGETVTANGGSGSGSGTTVEQTRSERAEGIEAVCAAWQAAADAEDNDTAAEALELAETTIRELPQNLRQGVRGDATTQCGGLKRTAESNIGERRRAEREG